MGIHDLTFNERLHATPNRRYKGRINLENMWYQKKQAKVRWKKNWRDKKSVIFSRGFYAQALGEFLKTLQQKKTAIVLVIKKLSN